MTGRYPRIFLFAIFAASMLLSAVYAGRHLYIRHVGITLRTDREFEPKKMLFHLQNDPRWASEPIGRSASTMGEAGCLLACVASAMTDLGVEVTPAQLNANLTSADGFSHDRLVWNRIGNAIPEFDYTYSRIFGAGRIQKDLERGLLPIVNVRYFKTGVTHWVVIVGAGGGEFLCLDPADRSRAPLPLSRHGKVYAYRVIRRRSPP